MIWRKLKNDSVHRKPIKFIFKNLFFSILNNYLKSRDQLTRFYFTLRILDRFYSSIETIYGIFFISKRFKEKLQNALERHLVITEIFHIHFVNQYVHRLWIIAFKWAITKTLPTHIWFWWNCEGGLKIRRCILVGRLRHEKIANEMENSLK